MSDKNTSLLLAAAAFCLIGFAVGRVTGSSNCEESCGPIKSSSAEVVRVIKTMDIESDEPMEAGEVEVIIERLSADGFEGDTTIAIPGGEARITRTGDNIEVSVKIED